MKWAFEISQTSLDIRNLFDLLNEIGFQQENVAGIDVAVSSQRLEAFNTADEVWDEAKRLRNLLSQETKVDPEFKIGRICDLSSEKPRLFYFLEVDPVIIEVSLGSPTVSVKPPDNLPADKLAEWHENQNELAYTARLDAQAAILVPAFRNPRAGKVLQILRQEPQTGESLFKIYEIVEEHFNNRKTFHKQFGISKVEFDRFCDVVHNAHVSGDWARHATKKQPNTPNPMTIEEAKAFVFDIARRWLTSLR